MNPTALIRDALRALDIDQLLFAIHDASFPTDRSEDIGRGAPSTAASARLLGFLSRLGFTGVQLGPQGQTSLGNPSPYDGTAFSRALESIPLSTWAELGVPDAQLRLAIDGADPESRADPARALRTAHRLAELAYDSAPPQRLLASANFRRAEAAWLERDALYAAISETHGGASAAYWPAGPERDGPTAELLAAHEPRIARYAFGQHLAHQAHAAFRDAATAHGLRVHADLQAGLSVVDAWGWRSALLPGYAMGAPPSRTTREGQPWGYPVIDPEQRDGAGGALWALRFDKVLREHDGVRIDHPHALVCPWVYRRDVEDAGEAVRHGARLYESPDLPDHPALARYAIARADQIDLAQPRHADHRVRALDDAQVDRYAVVIDVLLSTAQRHGRDPRGIACEVLSTMPHPLHAVLTRYGLGRFRVLQKAKLDQPDDVYRAHNAMPADWVMLGTHDTPSIWSVVHGFSPPDRARWAQHLGGALGCTVPPDEPDAIVHGMLAELLSSRARNLMIYFTDLFGVEERFNEPGTTSNANWSLRLSPAFEARYAERRARGTALDLPRALAMALDARGGSDPSLARALRQISGVN